MKYHSIACTRLFYMALTSAEGQKLQSYKNIIHSSFKSNMEI